MTKVAFLHCLHVNERLKRLFLRLMELYLIEHNSNHWILLLLLSSLFLLALVKYVSNIPLAVAFNHLLQLKSSDVSQDQIRPIVKVILLLNYAVVISIVISIGITIQKQATILQFKDYLPVFILTISFFLIKRYLSLFIASLLGFLEFMQLVALNRDRARMLTALPVLFILLIWVVIGTYDLNWLIGISIFLLLLLVLIIRLILGFKELFLRNVFYFIVYLCALEIAPYLLLYKYFIG